MADGISITTLVLDNGRVFVEVDSLVHYLQLNIASNNDKKSNDSLNELVKNLLSLKK